MCPTKSHLMQIVDCPQRCQSQKSVQTTTQLSVCVCACVYSCDCVWAPPPRQSARCLLCILLLCFLTRCSLKCPLWASFSFQNVCISVQSGYPVSPPAPGLVQSRRWPSLLHLSNWSRLVWEGKKRKRHHDSEAPIVKKQLQLSDQ